MRRGLALRMAVLSGVRHDPEKDGLILSVDADKRAPDAVPFDLSATLCSSNFSIRVELTDALRPGSALKVFSIGPSAAEFLSLSLKGGGNGWLVMESFGKKILSVRVDPTARVYLLSVRDSGVSVYADNKPQSGAKEMLPSIPSTDNQPLTCVIDPAAIGLKLKSVQFFNKKKVPTGV